MHHMRKTKTQFVKKAGAGGSFLSTLVNKLPFEMHLRDQNSIKDGIRMERQRSGVY